MAQVPEWIKLKKELYSHVHNQVQLRWGRLGIEIHAYREKYNHEVHRSWEISSKDELFSAIEKAKVIVLGDFHSLHQSQRSHLRILKNYTIDEFKIAVECVSYQHQKYIDQFLAGEINEKEFLLKINWKKNWGFPWEHYSEIFHFAKQSKIKIIGLNDVKLMSFKDSLLKRDKLATKIINKELAKGKESIFVIYGELHLTSKDFLLLNKVNRKLNCLRVFQNVDEIYFELMGMNKEAEVDVVRYNEKEFCLMNVPPWVKWQSYLMYIEKKYDSEIDTENPDYTDYVDQYIKVIAKELNIDCDTKNLSVYTSNDFSFLKSMKKDLSESEFAFYELLIEEEKSFYIPKLGIGYLGRMTINQAAALAMQYVYFEFIKVDKIPSMLPNNFINLIWIEAVCYFGSKLINPKRKTETIRDIKLKVVQFGSKDSNKEALKLALYQKTKELMRLSGRSFSHKKMIINKKASYIQCANLLGSMIGEKLYKGYRDQFVSLAMLKQLFGKKIDGKNFDKTYYAMLEIIENLPEAFNSKADKL